MRVVSLVPSVTETLMAWGVQPIAVTRFCQQPQLPSVGGTKNPDIAGIVALAPDVVIVDKEENRAEDAVALGRAGIDLHVTHVTSLADVDPTMAGLGQLLGRTDAEGPPLTPVPEVPGANRARLSAFIPIWRRPWMSINAATYGSSLLAAAGVDNIFNGAEERYPGVTLEEASARRPDVVLAPSEPYPFGDRHRRELAAVAPVVLVDGQDLFWWGVRTAGALRRLSTLLPPARPVRSAG
jgi:ABC-type Fe3+-hydroxamate transport system substrate-binding protein